MPINVEHGGQAGTAAGQMIAQAGQRSLDREQHDRQLSQELWARRDAQMRDIEARSNLQRQAADDATRRTALQFGLDQQVREDEFDRQLITMREQAKAQANQWEYRYTAQQRQEIAKFNNARQQIMTSNRFSPEEKREALRQIDLRQSSIEPSMMPRDENKPQYPEGKGVGEVWSDADGTLVSRKPDGSLQLIQRWDQGPEAAKMQLEAEKAKREYDAQLKQQELNLKQQQWVLETRIKLATEDIESGYDSDGMPTKRKRTPEEVEKIIRAAIGDGGQQYAQPAGSQQQSAPQGGGQLPQQVGNAQDFIRNMNNQFGGFEKVPPQLKQAYLEAAQIIQQYASS